MEIVYVVLECMGIVVGIMLFQIIDFWIGDVLLCWVWMNIGVCVLVCGVVQVLGFFGFVFLLEVEVGEQLYLVQFLLECL